MKFNFTTNVSQPSWRISIASVFVASSFLLVSVPVQAADQSSQAGSDTTQVQEIVVTARKHEEKLQDVPLTITALSSVTLDAAGVEDLRDITFLTPGLVYTSGGAQANAKPIIRGQSDIGSAVNNVAVFLDGIYISNSSAIDLGLVDLERIEVIKGPVSALYGRSAYSGAINYVTAVPTNDYKGAIEFTVGDYNKENVRFNLSGPIIDGVLKAGISGSYDHFDGTFHDSVTDQNANGDDRKDVLANLDFTPTDHIEIRPVAYYGADFFADNATKIAPANCGAAPLTTGFNYSRSYCGQVDPSNFLGPYIAAPGDYGTTGNNRFVLSTNLQVKIDYDWGSINSLTGFNNIRQTQYTEFDNTEYGVPAATYYLPPGAVNYTIPSNLALLGALPTGQTVLAPVHFGYQNRERDFSQELRYTSPQDQRFRWSIGGYYAKSFNLSDLRVAVSTENVPAGQYILSPFAVPPGTKFSQQQALTQQQDEIYAGFVSADFDILDNLTLSTELRETSTKSVFQENYSTYAPFGEGYSIGPPSAFNPIGGVEAHTYYSLTSRNTLTYKFSPEFMAYVSASNGEKVGGFNAIAIPAYQSYNPETNWTYEVGIKTSWLDNRLQLNADYFHIDAQNYQVNGPSDPTKAGAYITRNFGSLSTDGFEASAVVKPIAGITVSPGVAYANPQFNSDAYDFSFQDIAVCATQPSCASRLTTVGITPAVSLKGLRPPYESNWTFNLTVEASYPVYQDWNWFGRMDYRYEGREFYGYPTDTGSYGPRNNVNLHTGVENGVWSVTFWVNNLTNDQTPVNVQDAVATGSGANNFESGYYPVAILPDKRTLGATFKYKFGVRHEDAVAATTYTPPPVVAPAPAAVAHSYQVFFDFNKSDLTPEAVKVVDQAAANAAPAKVTRIDVTGHTDTVGSDAYNMRLSRRRAESVAAELQARGIPSSEIAIFAKGKKDLLVPTADGVREPQNRRVQIVYEGGPNS